MPTQNCEMSSINKKMAKKPYQNDMEYQSEQLTIYRKIPKRAEWSLLSLSRSVDQTGRKAMVGELSLPPPLLKIRIDIKNYVHPSV